MAVKIRLARRGSKKRPFYHIVAADVRAPRDGNYIEKLGTYNPMLDNDNEQRVTLVKDRVEHWLKNGAQPTERVAKMLGAAGLIEKPVFAERPKKSAPGKKALERLQEKKDKEEAAKAAAEEAKAAAEAESAAPAAEEAASEEAPAAEQEEPKADA